MRLELAGGREIPSAVAPELAIGGWVAGIEMPVGSTVEIWPGMIDFGRGVVIEVWLTPGSLVMVGSTEGVSEVV